MMERWKVRPRVRSYTYSAAGTYTVKLTVTNAGGSDSEVKTNYITVQVPLPPPPVAAFSATPLSGNAPLAVQFTDQSTGTVTSYAWDFTNDGTVESTSQSPMYTYSAAGTYTVKLTVTNAGGSDSEVKTNYITVQVPLPPAPVANFNSNISSGTTPLSVEFTDTTTGTGPLTYAWDFTNDGTVDSASQSPTYTYSTAGTYTVKLTVTNAGGSDSEVKTNYITVQVPLPPAPVANFNSNISSGTTPLSVEFTDTTTGTGPLTYAWDFTNDGTVESTSQSPIYTYSAAGTYTVKLTVTNAGGSDSEVKSNYITVQVPLPPAPVANFNANITSGTMPLTVQFTDSSTGTPTAWAWDFNNDGTIDNTIQNPVYTYSTSGVYSVNLTASNGGGSNSRLKSNYINVTQSVPIVDIIFDGTVTLTTGETFTKQAYNNATGVYTINRTTPLGALDKVSTLQGFTYNVTDKRWQYDQALMLDDVSHYNRKSPGYWYAYVNGVYKDSYGNHANGLNVIELNNNDQVNFFYSTGTNLTAPTDAIAAVKIKVNISGQPPVSDWTLSLDGAMTTSVTKTFFEQGLACPGSGHQVFWTDIDGNVWGGVPLWVLVGMVDDNPDVGPDHFNFNDSIAAQGYSVKVISGDGWDTTLASQDIARNNSYIVANTLNGQPLPYLTPGGKLSWPLHLKGAAVFGGQQVGNITRIELTGLPTPPTEWTLSLQGEVTDTITQSYFIDGIACHHNVTWTDPSTGTVWEGVSLWDLAGAVDDIETSSHFTFNETRAAAGYTIRVSAADGYNATFSSVDVAHNDGFFVAYKKNGAPVMGSDAPLKLVGSATTSGKQRVGGIAKISLEGLPNQYPAGNWQLNLVGKISALIPQPEFEYWASCHDATYTDTNGNVYTGVPLWRLMGWVDDRIPHGSNGFDDAAAMAGYKVVVKAGDGYAKEFTSQQIGKTNEFIVANTYNGGPIPNDGSHPPYPLRLVGSGATGGNSVGNVVEILLTDFQTPVEVPKLHIIKYGSDGTTVINETTIDYYYMESNLPVIGDGTTAYKFEGLTLNSSNLWDPEETYPGGFKVSNVVKGTRVHDLAELVGGMGSGTTITLIANDGFETTLPYSSIYTNPAVQARQGDAIVAWWGDGQYVPQYSDGMRLFFTPDGDHVYGQWDMHETLPSQYWRYNFQDNVKYPSCAGLSAKFITTIKVYSSPESDWTLELDGRDIGGLQYNVSKPFLEEAIACQFGADHKASYTDSKSRIWEGMPLWFFVGFVDDQDQHSPNAYNETLALAGYNIVITGNDDYTTTLYSRDIIRSSNYLVANSLNGTHIADDDENWPLRFTGANVSGSMVVKGVKSIRLVRIVQPPVADFTATPGSGPVPLAVQFTDASTGAATWSWTFGDGTTSTTQNPSHTYTDAGTYNATLTVTNPGGSSEKQLPISVTISPPVADFTATPGSGPAPLAVQFTDASTGAATWSWTFGDGTTSTIQNPSHTYIDAGTFTATLTVTNPGGISSKPLQIPVTLSPPVADFTATPTSGTVPLAVRFTDASTGATSWSWVFGDGTSSTEQSPMHSYTTAGTYTVVLTATNAGGSSVMTKPGYISVIPPDFYADFTVSPVEGTAPLTVKCTDKSTGNPTWFAYDFGDGVTMTSPNPVHTYMLPGVYNITLTVMKFDRATFSTKVSSTKKQNVVTVDRVPFIEPVAMFTASPVQGIAPLTVGFTDQSSGEPTLYSYDFGDGVNITGPNPVHTYRYPGTYTVTLTVVKNDAATGTIASNSFIQPDLVVVQG